MDYLFGLIQWYIMIVINNLNKKNEEFNFFNFEHHN